MRGVTIIAGVALAVLATFGCASATTYTYEINAAPGIGPGDITGSFTMDPGNPTSISNIDINASLPSHYQASTVNLSFDQAVYPDQTWPIGYLWFTNPALNNGNAWNYTFLMFATPVDATLLHCQQILACGSESYTIGLGFNNHNSEIDAGGDSWNYIAGELTVTPTPLPAALPLFATGLGGLGLLGWRRKRKAQAVA